MNNIKIWNAFDQNKDVDKQAIKMVDPSHWECSQDKHSFTRKPCWLLGTTTHYHSCGREDTVVAWYHNTLPLLWSRRHSGSLVPQHTTTPVVAKTQWLLGTTTHYHSRGREDTVVAWYHNKLPLLCSECYHNRYHRT